MPEKKKREAALQPAIFNITQMESTQEPNEELQGAAAAADSYYIIKNALLRSLKESEEHSIEVNRWIYYVKYNASRNIPLLKGKAQAAATSFTAMEHSLFQAENLIEKWEEVNTTPDEKLTTKITYLDRCLTTAKVCFHGYGKKNPLDAAMLNLKFLPDGSHNPPTRTFSRVQHILDTMLDEMIAQLSSEEPEAIASMPAEEEDADTRVDNVSSPTHVDATYSPTRGEEQVASSHDVEENKINVSDNAVSQPVFNNFCHKEGNNYVDICIPVTQCYN